VESGHSRRNFVTLRAPGLAAGAAGR